eukprot:4385056-Pleurochrysis_carterae.AAC.1
MCAFASARASRLPVTRGAEKQAQLHCLAARTCSRAGPHESRTSSSVKTNRSRVRCLFSRSPVTPDSDIDGGAGGAMPCYAAQRCAAAAAWIPVPVRAVSSDKYP